MLHHKVQTIENNVLEYMGNTTCFAHLPAFFTFSPHFIVIIFAHTFMCIFPVRKISMIHKEKRTVHHQHQSCTPFSSAIF